MMGGKERVALLFELLIRLKRWPCAIACSVWAHSAAKTLRYRIIYANSTVSEKEGSYNTVNQRSLISPPKIPRREVLYSVGGGLERALV